MGESKNALYPDVHIGINTFDFGPPEQRNPTALYPRNTPKEGGTSGRGRAGITTSSPHWITRKCPKAQGPKVPQGTGTDYCQPCPLLPCKAHSSFHSPKNHEASFLFGQATTEAFWHILAGRIHITLHPLTLSYGETKTVPQVCVPDLGLLHYRGFLRT